MVLLLVLVYHCVEFSDVSSILIPGRIQVSSLFYQLFYAFIRYWGSYGCLQSWTIYTGVRMTSKAGNSSSEVELQLSDYFKEVSISMLSDDNFSEVISISLFDIADWNNLKNVSVKI